MKYRREIDGLRAVAVLPVILFHAGVPGFGGGYVGVDVFFVISGFLITQVLAVDLEENAFSIRKFYERRARRILPALFLVMAACIPFAWLWLTPAAAREFGKSLIATTLFGANMLFWRETGYFATAAEMKPLLHTWSLAVEEQFYLFYPIGLGLLWRLRARRRVALLGVAALASLALAQWAMTTRPAAGFYLAPTRAWELLIGALLALSPAVRQGPTARPLLNETGSVIGLALVVGSIIMFDVETAVPGLPTLAPTLGAALILATTSPATVVGKILGSAPMVGVGLISYSAYLWHQPLFAFARLRSVAPPGAGVYAVLCAATIVLAYLTWRYVETPLRNPSRVSRRTVIRGMLAVGAVLLVVGSASYTTDGASLSRHDVADIEHRLRANRGISDDCIDATFDPSACANTPSPAVLLWGDSFAMHLWQGLVHDSTPLGGVVQATRSACAPVLGIALQRAKSLQQVEDCLRFNANVFNYLQSAPHVRHVVVSARWDFFFDSASVAVLHDGRRMAAVDTARAAVIETLRRIQALGKQVVVFSPPPRDGSDIGGCLLRSAMFAGDQSARCDLDVAQSRRWRPAVYDLLEDVEKMFPVVWLDDGMCREGRCFAAVDGVLLYRDDGHLSHEGSAFLGRVMDWPGRVLGTSGSIGY